MRMTEKPNIISKLRTTYPSRIPCVVLFKDHVMKFMVPADTTGSSFLVCIRVQLKKRKYISLTADRAIFVFHNNKQLPGPLPLSDLDIDKSKPLTFEVQLENVFG